MISRIRVEACGVSASEVERNFLSFTKDINELLKVPTMLGEQVIERQMAEPEDSRWAFKGRLILHPDVSE